MKISTAIQKELPRKNLKLLICAFIVFIFLSLLFVFSWQLVKFRNDKMSGAQIATFNIVKATEQKLVGNLINSYNLLDFISSRIKSNGADIHIGFPEIFTEPLMAVDGVNGVFVYNSAGDLLSSSGSVKLSSNNGYHFKFFSYHKVKNETKPLIGSIIKDDDGNMNIPISQRINDSNGNFAGVIVVTSSVSYYQDFFEKINVDKDGVIFIALTNGDLLSRKPTINSLDTTNVSRGEIFSKYLPRSSNGNAVITSIVDKVERVYFYEKIQNFPIVIAAGVSFYNLFSSWELYVYQAAAILFIIISALVFIGFFLYFQVNSLIIAEADLKLAKSELELIANTDGLTGLSNRRSFDAALQREWGRANRNKLNISILLIDIDWFKQYNDNYGHLQGDECLRKVSEIIKLHASRSADFPARFGGEEFIVLLPDTDLEGAIHIATFLKSAILNANIEHAYSKFKKVTISVGVISTQSPDKDSYIVALADADRLLYIAKDKGRNRIEAGLLKIN